MKAIDHKKFENFRDMVLQKELDGKIVISTFDGFIEIAIDKILKQPIEGVLYDLNRCKPVILTYIEDKKWVNDYACNIVMRKLSSLLTAARSENTQLKGKIDKLKKDLTSQKT